MVLSSDDPKYGGCGAALGKSWVTKTEKDQHILTLDLPARTCFVLKERGSGETVPASRGRKQPRTKPAG